MRYLLLLFLSFPAYAAIIDAQAVKWHLNGSAGSGTISGFFTSAGNTITDWNIVWRTPFNSVLTLTPNCGQPIGDVGVPPPGNCSWPEIGWAEVLSPTHLHFHWDSTPDSDRQLDLLLTAPLGIEPNSTTGTFIWHDFMLGTQFDPVQGTITAPEPSVFIALLIMLLGCKLWKRNRMS